MSEVLDNNPVLLGKVAATHGIRGELRIAVFSGQFETILSLSSLLIKRPDGGMEKFEFAAKAARGNKLIVAFIGYESINKVSHLVGRELYTTRGELPELAVGEFYWCDLLGLKVVTDAGITLGFVTDIIATGSNDVYVVKNDEREYLIPALDDVVLDIDLENETMLVSPPEGLLDL